MAAELGWIVAEYGRQPWAIAGVLPTFLAVSPIPAANVALSLTGFVVFYSLLAVIDVYLLHKYIRRGPEQATAPDVNTLPRAAAMAPHKNEESAMFDYATLKFIWWLLLGVLLIGFAIMDGFDLGVGMLLPFIAKGDTERRVVINTVGPVWEGNQVWLILGGGAIFAAWPSLYAASFSGFYLAMLLVLAALILRPVGFKFRSKMPSARWRGTWDWALFVGGAVPAHSYSA